MKYLWLILLLPVMAWADSESQTCGTANSAGNKWSNATNAQGSGDNSCATYSGTKSDELDCSNFGFSSVEGTVDSINVVIDGYGNSGTQADREIYVQLTKIAGTGTGDQVRDVDLTNGADCSASGDRSVLGNVLWGTTWSVAEVTASGFGCVIADDDATASELGVDAITITVWYTPSGGVYPGQIIKIGGD